LKGLGALVADDFKRGAYVEASGGVKWVMTTDVSLGGGASRDQRGSLVLLISGSAVPVSAFVLVMLYPVGKLQGSHGGQRSSSKIEDVVTWLGLPKQAASG
jgi:hypothetical protein